MTYRNDTKVVSHRCDTVPSYRESNNMIAEVEIPTTASRARSGRMIGRFLKGPIAMPDIARAARLGGRTLAVYLAVHHQTALTGKRTVSLPKGLLADLGIDKDAKARGLRALEATGLVTVERVKGRAAKVELASRNTLSGSLR